MGNLYSEIKPENKKYYIKSSETECDKDEYYKPYCNECIGIGKDKKDYESEFKCPVNFDDLKTSSHFTVSIDISYYVRLYLFDIYCLKKQRKNFDVYFEIYKDSIDILKLYGNVNEKLIDSLHGFILYVIDYSSNMLRWKKDQRSYAKSYFSLKPRTKIINLFNSFSEDLQKLIMSIEFPEDYNDSLFFKRIIKSGMNIEKFFKVIHDIHEYDKKQNDDRQITVEFRNSFNYGTFLSFKQEFFINLQNMFKYLQNPYDPSAPRGRAPRSRSSSPAPPGRVPSDRGRDRDRDRDRGRGRDAQFKSKTKKSKTLKKSKTNSKKTNSKKTKSKTKSKINSKTKSKKSKTKSKINSKSNSNSKPKLFF